MKFKKLFLFFLLFTGIIGCGCFNAPEEWNIENFEAFVVDKNNQSPVNGIIEGDSLTLEIFFEATFVETFQNPLHGLLNAAWALSCEDPGHLGLEDKVEQFIITSNTEFNEVPIGDPLNEFILTRRNQLISEWISESEDWSFISQRNTELIFIEKPSAGSKHVFNLKFVLASGKIIEQKTEEVQWN